MTLHIAQLYVTKFSTISPYLTKLYVTQNFAIIASSVKYNEICRNFYNSVDSDKERETERQAPDKHKYIIFSTRKRKREYIYIFMANIILGTVAPSPHCHFHLSHIYCTYTVLELLMWSMQGGVILREHFFNTFHVQCHIVLGPHFQNFTF